MSECTIKDNDGYFQIVDFNLEADDFHDIFQKIEDALLLKKQDLLFSLATVGVLYSSHLAMLVRIHQLMHKNSLRFVISDISAEIKNLLQITQLDSIFSTYETVDDFKNSLKKIAEEKTQPQINFEWQITKTDQDVANVICQGNMFAGEQLDKLQESVSDFYSIIFDFSNLQSMDSASITFLDKFADNHSVSVAGANEELIEQFRQKLIYGKMKLL
ncbi:MAG: STAS domain-containing protein [Fibromonadales bacterium]|nr:STAS domain-containing protein [Fibromonadales bacterium]